MSLFHINGRVYEYDGDRGSLNFVISSNGTVMINGKSARPRPVLDVSAIRQAIATLHKYQHKGA